jgi:hypothetical protein
VGTAGLNIKRLSDLLARRKVECILVDGDAALDHCVLRLSSDMHPNVVAFLEYENQGTEPRLVGIVFRGDEFTPQKEDYPLEWQKTLKLEGERKADSSKIAEWIEREYLNIVI